MIYFPFAVPDGQFTEQMLCLIIFLLRKETQQNIQRKKHTALLLPLCLSSRVKKICISVFTKFEN
jgi:hypothetical protein